MATKVRKQVYIESHQEDTLKRLAGETGMSEAEVIRQAIDRYTRSSRLPKHDLNAWDRERAFIARLIQQGSAPGRRTWGREDLHER